MGMFLTADGTADVTAQMTEQMTETFTSSIGSASTTAITLMAAVVGVGLTIFALKFAVTKGLSFFKSIAGK